MAEEKMMIYDDSRKVIIDVTESPYGLTFEKKKHEGGRGIRRVV